MQSFRGTIRLLQRHTFTTANTSPANGFIPTKSPSHSFDSLKNSLLRSGHAFASRSQVKLGSQIELFSSVNFYGTSTRACLFQTELMEPPSATRCNSTMGNSVELASKDPSSTVSDVPSRIKFKRLDKTARRIMQILDKEAINEVRGQRDLPDIRPGYIVQLKVEVPENKRRVSILKGIVIARRNAGINTTFRIRRLVAGVGVESLFPLYSPNIKEIKVLDKKKVRRAKLYYLRDRMNPLKK